MTLASILATTRLGCSPIILHTGLAPDFIAANLGDTQPDLVLCDSDTQKAYAGVFHQECAGALLELPALSATKVRPGTSRRPRRFASCGESGMGSIVLLRDDDGGIKGD